MKSWSGERPHETSNECISCRISETSISSQSLRDIFHLGYVTHLCDDEFQSIVILEAISVFKCDQKYFVISNRIDRHHKESGKDVSLTSVTRIPRIYSQSTNDIPLGSFLKVGVASRNYKPFYLLRPMLIPLKNTLDVIFIILRASQVINLMLQPLGFHRQRSCHVKSILFSGQSGIRRGRFKL